MLGINKGPIIDELETILFRVTTTPNPSAIGRGRIIGVIFQNPLLEVDGTSNNAQVWIGNSTDQLYLMIPGMESPIFYAEDLKDIYTKLFFPFPSPNGAIATAGTPSSARGTGYVTGDVLTVTSPGGVDATVTASSVRGALTTVTLLAAGAGFTAGDVLAIAGGTGGTVTVDTVDGGGAILTFHVSAGGTNYLQGVHAASGGTGAGASFNATVITGEVLGVTVVTGGTLFSAGSAYVTTGGAGTGAQVLVDTVTDTVPSECNLTVICYRKREGGIQ